MPRVSIVMCVHDQVALTRACLDSLRATTEPLGVVVVDNGSTDATPRLLGEWPYPFPVRVHRNPENGPVIRAFNQGCRLADSEFVCLLHNDTELLDPDWLRRMVHLADADASIGLIGLYGAQRVRRDGRYAGRTIVHGLLPAPALASDATVEVAAVDGVCLFTRRAVLETLGGFDEAYGFFHGYDRDFSFGVREAGLRCLVIGARFRHHGGGTRARAFGGAEQARADLQARRAALDRFVAKYRHRLPADVRSVPGRLRERFRWCRTRRS